MDLQALAADMFNDKVGSGLDTGAVGDALRELIGPGKELDLAGMVAELTNGGLADAAKSWLGDGANQAVSGGQILEGLGADKLAGFAKQLGLDPETAADGLAQVIPDLVDQSSSGGDLLGSLTSSLFK